MVSAVEEKDMQTQGHLITLCHGVYIAACSSHWWSGNKNIPLVMVLQKKKKKKKEYLFRMNQTFEMSFWLFREAW